MAQEDHGHRVNRGFKTKLGRKVIPELVIEEGRKAIIEGNPSINRVPSTRGVSGGLCRLCPSRSF